METISVVIPVYNSARYLRECVDSVLEQSYRDLDVILVDDGSSDESPSVCAEYASRDSRVRFFRLEPVGVGAARNFGISKAMGKYLIFVDSDDVCEASLAEQLVVGREQAESESCVLSLCGITVTNPEGRETGAFREDGISGRVPVREYVRKVLTKWQSNPLCGGVYCKLFETEILNRYDVRFEENETYAEDFLFNLAYLAHVDEVTILPDCLYRYRVGRSGSLTEENMQAVDPETVWTRRRQVMRAYEDVFAGLGLGNECADAIRAYRLKNTTDVVEIAVRQGVRGEAFAAWMAPLRKELETLGELDGVPGKYQVTLKLLRSGRYGLLREYEAMRRRVRILRGRER